MARMIALHLLTLMLASLPQVATAQEALSKAQHEFRVGEVRLWYRVAGRESGVPVIFLHGGPGEGSQVFQSVGGPELEKTERVVYLDQRGAARSDRPKEASNYSLDIMVDDIEQLRRHLGVPKIVLLGHSFGTQLALEYATRYPERVQALVLAAATPDLLRSLDLQCRRLAEKDPQAYARARQELSASAFPRCDTRRAYEGEAANAFRVGNVYPNPRTAELVERLDNAEGVKNDGEVSSALFRKGLLQYRFAKSDLVRAPVLVIAGGRDFQAALDPQRDLVQGLRKGELMIYPEAGHFPFVDEPRRFARDVSRFLRASR